MKDFEAFQETQRGMIKRKSRYGSKTYMYTDRTGFVVQDGERMRDARQDELVGFENWIPSEDEFGKEEINNANDI